MEATALCRETASTGYGVSNKCFEIPWPELKWTPDLGPGIAEIKV